VGVEFIEIRLADFADGWLVGGFFSRDIVGATKTSVSRINIREPYLCETADYRSVNYSPRSPNLGLPSE